MLVSTAFSLGGGDYRGKKKKRRRKTEKTCGEKNYTGSLHRWGGVAATEINQKQSQQEGKNLAIGIDAHFLVTPKQA